MADAGQEIAIPFALPAVLIILFCATIVRSAFGFGEALIAVPLLTFWMPLRTATPLAVLASVTVALIVVAQDWRHIQWRAASGLLAWTLLGLPFGLLLLTSSHQRGLRFGLGALIALFSLYALAGRKRTKLRIEHRGWTVLFGALAGFLGGAFGMNGPALAIYGALRRWPAADFRATLQAYFLPASAMELIGFWRSGLWGAGGNHLYLTSLLVIVPGVLIGRWISQKLDREHFLKYIHVALIVIGCMVMAEAAGRPSL